MLKAESAFTRDKGLEILFNFSLVTESLTNNAAIKYGFYIT